MSATPVPAQVRHRVPKHLEIAASAAEIAVEAGALIRGYFERGVATEYKGDVDLVTEADRDSEKLITERLTAAFPDHGIYGEEGVRQRIDHEYRWYVDPLDGTTNFAHGFPVFSAAIALRGATKQSPGTVGSPAMVGGVSVAAGDWVVGDADGVVVVSADDLESVLEAGRARAKKEQAMFEALRKGSTTIELLDLDATPVRVAD